MNVRLLLLCLCLVLFSGCNPFVKRGKTGLQVMTNDIPSSVFINGQFIEKTPVIDKSLPPGEYSIKIVPDNEEYVQYETSVNLRNGLLTVVTWKPGKSPESSGGVTYEMEPLPSKTASEISFFTIPDGAIVKLDDREKEFSPVVISDITPGHHEFEVTLPSYETQNHTINVVEGYRMVVKIKLAKLDSTNTSNNTVITTDTLQASESATITVATQSALPPPYVIIKSTNYFVDDKEVLKVRQEATASAAEVGTVDVKKQYAYIAEKDGWYNISFNRTKGWISSKYADLIQ